MTTFPQLKRFESEVDGATIDLPLRGKVYSFPVSVPIDLGLKLSVMREEVHRAQQAAEQGVEYEVDDDARELFEEDGDSMRRLYLRLLGDRLSELQADGVTWHEVIHIGETLLIFHTAGLEAALMVWQAHEAGEGDASPPAGKPTTRAGSSRRTTSPSTSKKTKPTATSTRPSRGAKSSKPGN